MEKILIKKTQSGDLIEENLLLQFNINEIFIRKDLNEEQKKKLLLEQQKEIRLKQSSKSSNSATKSSF